MKTPRAISPLRFASALAVVLASSAYAGVSYAFPAHKYWEMPASGASSDTGQRPGAEGIYYTGGAQDFGMKCSHCHIDNAQQQGSISATVTPSPAWGSVGGSEAYKPGQTYTITVNLVGAHLGSGSNDQNNMTLTIEDPSGQVAGVFEADAGGKSDSSACKNGMAPDPVVTPTTAQTTVIFGDCHAVLSFEHEVGKDARTSWTFKWTAPAAGTGDVTIWVGVVDGDSAGASSLGDDVTEASIVVKEGA